MKKAIWVASIAAAALNSFAQPSSNNEGYTSFYYDNSLDAPVVYSIPAWAVIKGFTLTSQGETSTLTVEMQEPVNLTTQARFMIEAYADSQIAVVWTFGSFTFPSNPNLLPGQAGVVSLADGALLGNATASVSGRVVTIQFATALLAGGVFDYICTRYLPLSVNLENVAGGMAACVASARLFFPPGEPPPAFIVTGVLHLMQSPRRIPIELPVGPEFRCPPQGPRAGQIPKPGDVNGDGRPDWDYPEVRRLKVPGTNLVVGIFGIDLGPEGAVLVDGKFPDTYGVAIGNDDNGNGFLDWNEIDAWIGKNAFDGGDNKCWLENDDGVWKVHWVSRHPTDGRVRHYVYDTQTGILAVYTEGGHLQFYGDPRDYPYFWPVGGGG